MPQMGYDMQEGTLVRWLKREGAEVKVGDAIAEIETDKAVVEFEASEAGVLNKLLVAEGTSVPVGKPIAIIGAPGEKVTAPAAAPAPAPAANGKGAPASSPKRPPEAVEARQEPVTAPAPADDHAAAPGEVRASPVARKLADEMGIDLSKIKGTGPGGRITRDDVMAADKSKAAKTETKAEPQKPAEATARLAAPAPAAPKKEAPAAEHAPAPAAKPGEKVPLSKMRQQIARVTTKSKQEIPHFYVTAEIDMTEAMKLRKQINASLESEGIKISVNDLIIKACVGALRKIPNLNSSYTGDAIQNHPSINIGIAIAMEDGLIMPAIMDCAGKTLAQISQASKDLITRAQKGTLHAQEYTGGTFSISNMGMFEVTNFAAIIQPPQAGVLAVGTVMKKPVVRNDQVVIAETMNATLSVDHRVSDGAEGAKFIVEVKKDLENPLSLLV